MTELSRQLDGWRLTTAEILYRMPDHPHLLQSFVWQKLDRAPDLPQLREFLGFWEREIEGDIHSVRVAWRGLVSPAEMRVTDGMYTLH